MRQFFVSISVLMIFLLSSCASKHVIAVPLHKWLDLPEAQVTKLIKYKPSHREETQQGITVTYDNMHYLGQEGTLLLTFQNDHLHDYGFVITGDVRTVLVEALSQQLQQEPQSQELLFSWEFDLYSIQVAWFDNPSQTMLLGSSYQEHKALT
jgi:hypothetical protein